MLVSVSIVFLLSRDQADGPVGAGVGQRPGVRERPGNGKAAAEGNQPRQMQKTNEARQSRGFPGIGAKAPLFRVEPLTQSQYCFSITSQMK